MIQFSFSNNDSMSFWQSLCDQIALPSSEKKIEIKRRGFELQTEYFTITEGCDVVLSEFNCYTPTEIRMSPIEKKNHVYRIDLGLFNSELEVFQQDTTGSFPAQVFYSANYAYKFKLPLNVGCQLVSFFLTEEFLKSIQAPSLYGSQSQISKLLSIHEFTSVQFYETKSLFKKTTDSRLLQIQQYVWRNIPQLLTYGFDSKTSEVYSLPYSRKDIQGMTDLIHRLSEGNIQERVSLKEMADEVNMSISKFKMIFKEITNESPYEFHLKAKIGKAQEMLSTGLYSVSQISNIMGYAAPIKFLQTFKKFVGETPGRWMRNNQA